MVGSISWIINADGVGELIEPVQINTALITPTPVTIDPISEPPPRSSSSTICHPLPRYPRKRIDNDDLIVSIDQVGQKLADCLSIIESALTTLVQRRPPSNSDPLEINQETPGVTALPFGLTSVAVSYKDALRGKFTGQVGDIYPLVDQITDHLSSTINMLQIGQHPDESLHSILEENLDSEP